MAFLSTDLEFNAFTNLLTAAAVNKRLLMRVLAHLEKKDLKELHAEVTLLNEEFRGTIAAELRDLIERHGGKLDEPTDEMARAYELAPLEKPLSVDQH